MAFATGGRMKREIFDDPYTLDDWDLEHSSRCFVNICNSLVWRSITGEAPPTVPPTAEEYTRYGLPWFDYYDDDAKALVGSEALKGMKSVAILGKEKGDVPLSENASVTPEHIVELRRGMGRDEVREFTTSEGSN